MRMSVQNRHAVLMYLLLGENKEGSHASEEVPKIQLGKITDRSYHTVSLPGRSACRHPTPLPVWGNFLSGVHLA